MSLDYCRRSLRYLVALISRGTIRRQNPTSDEWLLWGSGLLREGDLDSALLCYRRALDLCPENIDALKGFTLFRLLRYREAKVCFERCVLLSSGDVCGLYMRDVALRGRRAGSRL